MILAAEAKAKYNRHKELAEKFIREVVEPSILTVAETKTSITLQGVDVWYVGSSYYFDPKDVKYGYDISLTKEVNKLLEESGYLVSSFTTIGGSEYQNGVVEWTIDWSEA